MNTTTAPAPSRQTTGSELYAVDLTGATKSFGATQAVRGVDLRVRPGEVVALLGPNGAGKTTTLDMILGLGIPTTGEVSRSEEHTSELQARFDLVCRPLLEKKKQK